MAYCHKDSILLLVIVLHLLLCLVYKLNVIIVAYVQYRKKYSTCRVGYYPSFQASAGGLGTYTFWIRRDYCKSF